MGFRFIISLALAATSSVRAEEVSYAREILPILSDNCFRCHGPDHETQEADLRLDLREVAIKSGAIQPGDAAASEAITRIFSRDPDELMPPPDSHLKLTRTEKDLLRRWVEEGAEYQAHWAFVAPPESVPMPETKDTEWPRNPVDRFILARLEQEGLSPSEPASDARWLRRATYDLTGLPPTQAELDRFLSDSSDEAREKVVDRLLASPRFGEHFAVQWLDLARYADSFGYQADVDMRAWPYRDWVIDAFNRNLPIDDFIIEQLAGDLLPNATRDQKIATAFNRVHRATNEGGSVPEEFRQEGISDRIHTMGTAFLGLTLECARCHDHKYDPISTREYYSFGAFFNSIDEVGVIQGGASRGVVLPQPTLELPTPEQEAKLTSLEKQISTAEKALKAHISSADAAFENWLASGSEFPEADLAGRFTFDAPSGDPAANEVQPKQKLNLAGNSLTEGRAGKALLADGDSLSQVPDFGVKHADQPFSISMWLKPGEPYPRAIIFANTSSFDLPFSGYELILLDGKLRWMLAREFPGCAAAVISEESLPVGEWTHVTVTNDGSRRAAGLRMYLNGRRAETSIVRDNLTRDYHSGNKLVLSARGRDFGIRGGMLDDITFHTRAITPVEARALHAGTALAKTEGNREELRDYYFSAVDPTARDLAAKLTAVRLEYRHIEAEVAAIITMRETDAPRPAFILARGDYTQPTDKVERVTPDWLPPFPEDQPRNRLGLARWMTSPDHPLTARVTVNRLWSNLFGRGLVPTTDNFGLQGTQASHPALLDWLARDLIAHGWDRKRMLRQLVLSATYAQDSALTPELRELDPENELLARGPARRQTAEMLRDSSLALSGLLVENVGGPPVYPYQPEGAMWKVLNNFLPAYKRDTGDGLYRRSLYSFWRRTTPAPNMMIFDTTARDACSAQRTATNTPLQPLVTLNDPQFVEAARKLAERVLRQGGDSNESRVRWAFREVLARDADPQRLELLADLLTEQREFFASGSSEAAKLLAIGDAKPDPSFDPVELAATTALCQTLLNLDAHLTVR